MTDYLSYLKKEEETEKVKLSGQLSDSQTMDIVKDISRISEFMYRFSPSDFYLHGNSIPEDDLIIKNDYTVRHQKIICPVCGKEMDIPTASGCCSIECWLKASAIKLSGKVQQFKNTIENAEGNLYSATVMLKTLTEKLSEIKSTMDSIGLPDMTAIDYQAKTAENKIIPSQYNDKYSAWIKVQLLRLSAMLRKEINEVEIWKNDFITSLFSEIKSGLKPETSALNESILKSVKTFNDKAEELKNSYIINFNILYKKAFVNDISYRLDPVSMNFFKTSRSKVRIPGKNILKLQNKNSGNSAFDSLNIDPMEESIQNMFLELKQSEYFIDPSVFKNKIDFSSVNAEKMKNYTNQIKNLFKTATEPLPSYKDLNVKNLNWDAFILSSWAPMGKETYGKPYYP